MRVYVGKIKGSGGNIVRIWDGWGEKGGWGVFYSLREGGLVLFCV